MSAPVRRGRGRTLYTVTGAWSTADGTLMASLTPVEGYTSASAPLAALRCACGGDLGSATGVCVVCGADCLGYYDDVAGL